MKLSGRFQSDSSDESSILVIVLSMLLHKIALREMRAKHSCFYRLVSGNSGNEESESANLRKLPSFDRSTVC